MPEFWNNQLVVTKEELIPTCYPSYDALKKAIKRYERKEYGIKKLQNGGNGHPLLIDFDSLSEQHKQIIGDPRSTEHILANYYKIDQQAVRFYASFRFDDDTYLSPDHQEKYIINASVLKAAAALRNARAAERISKSGTAWGLMVSICADVNSFNAILKAKYQVEHSLPHSYERFTKTFNQFEREGYKTLITGYHKNDNRRKVFNETLELLRNLFADDVKKPTATKIHRVYNSFLAGYTTIVNNATGELYNRKEFKKLSDSTIKKYLAEWENAIITETKRSGDRQKAMSKFKPYHSYERPKFAGSTISIDDRQPPFKMPDGNRIWFYNGIDLASEAFICWVHGKSKEGIILEFYRQLVRNFTKWGFNLPAGLECEMSLNSNFKDTFLREGAMFDSVRIEANNARGKRIEAYYRNLRYDFEKERTGWLARPHARAEANQAGPKEVPTLFYDDIVEGCLQDIADWNNSPHTDFPYLSRWRVFCERQNPNLKPTNWASFLPYIGFKTKTSVHAGIIKLNNQLFLLGDNGQIASSDHLINLMKQVEGKEVTIYWLDNDETGDVLKALVYNQQGVLVCEAVTKPKPQRATIEQTDEDREQMRLMSAYVATIENYAKRGRNQLERLTIINHEPKTPFNDFVMPGLKKASAEKETGELLDDEPEEMISWPASKPDQSLRNRF
ncbi:MAG: hypothetical protein IE931_05715 [Sphingobacteriales bacterium]|nr:hypothetical protein [Sphingobacteriales bacterium]